MKEASAIKTNIGKLLKKVESEKVLRDIQALLKEKSSQQASRSTKDVAITFPDLEKRLGKTGEN
ncbi:MAG: hypothetical protein ACXVP0_07420 [Bacteroidia bacterium]